MNFIKKIIPKIDSYASNAYSFERAKTLVQFFYYFQIAFALMAIIRLGGAEPGRAGFFPIWPVFWVGSIPYSEVRIYIFIIYLLTSFIGSVFWSKGIGRIISFLGLLQFHSLESSFGAYNFFIYPWLYTSFLFMFLPGVDKGNTLTIKKKFLLVFWGAQALFLLTYSMAGTHKVIEAFRQLLAGQISAFHPDAFALQILWQTFTWDTKPFLAEFLTNLKIIAWPMYIGAIYFEFFAFWAAVKPSLQRIWGFMLIFLHVGAVLFMGIPFWEHTVLLSILFLNSPFAINANIQEIVDDLPVVGFFKKRLFNK